MNAVSAVIRLVCGAAILVLAWTVWSKNKAAIAAGEPVHLFGQTFQSTPGTFNIGLGVIAVVGLGLLLLGLMGLLGGKK